MPCARDNPLGSQSPIVNPDQTWLGATGVPVAVVRNVMGLPTDETYYSMYLGVAIR